MRPEYATPEDFAKRRSHAETLDTYSLRYIITDCRKAAANLRQVNPVREGSTKTKLSLTLTNFTGGNYDQRSIQ